MATAKKSGQVAPKWKMSWKRLFFAASVALNIGGLVILITLVSTNSLDNLWIREGLDRYCASANDSKFKDNTEASKALRDFTCAKGDASKDFQQAFDAYLKTRTQ